jgi:hypothetical protein
MQIIFIELFFNRHGEWFLDFSRQGATTRHIRCFGIGRIFRESRRQITTMSRSRGRVENGMTNGMRVRRWLESSEVLIDPNAVSGF